MTVYMITDDNVQMVPHPLIGLDPNTFTPGTYIHGAPWVEWMRVIRRGPPGREGSNAFESLDESLVPPSVKLRLMVGK